MDLGLPRAQGRLGSRGLGSRGRSDRGHAGGPAGSHGASLLAAAASVLGLMLLAPGARAANTIYWTNSAGNSLSAAALSGGGGRALKASGATIASPEGVVISPALGRIYWANRTANKISWARLDGHGGGDLTIKGATVSEPEGLGIVPAEGGRPGRLYWANHGANKISWTGLEGGPGGDVNTGGATVDEPVGVAIDMPGRIFWANDGGGTGGISGAYLSGYELRGGGYGGFNLEPHGATVNRPGGLVFDPGGERLQGGKETSVRARLYWTNSGANRISWDNVGEEAGGDLDTGTATVNGPLGLVLDPEAGRIYWVNQGAGTVSYVGLEGGGAGELLAPGAPADAPAFAALMQAPVVSRMTMFVPFIFWGGEERTPPVGKTLICNPTAPTWEPDVPGDLLFRAPTQNVLTWQFNGADIPGESMFPRSYTLIPTEPGIYGCRMTASNAAGSTAQISQQVQVVPAPPGAPAVPAPRLTHLSQVTGRFLPSSASTPLVGRTSRHVQRGTAFSFALNVAATVGVSIERQGSGRRVGSACRPPSRRLAHARACVLYTRVWTLTRAGRAGGNHISFSGRVRGRALSAGHYRAVFMAVDTAGRSKAQAVYFTVL